MEAVALIIVIAALAVGLAAGWFFGSRQSGTFRQERDSLQQRVGQAEVAAAAAEERARQGELLRMTLTEVTNERDEAQRQLAALQADARSFDVRLKELTEAKDVLAAQFSQVGAKLLEEAQKNFLERADARFNQAGEKNEEKLKALLQPVETTLKRYEEGLTKVEKERVGSYEALKEAVAQLAQGNEHVRRETQRLANVMRSSPKARGRWGEEQLRTILEAAGLAENVDFTLQSTVSDGERQLRPDCVINLPGERCIVIDVKCPLVAFEQAFDEEDETVRGDLLLQHAAAMKSYASDLGRKGYWRQFDLSPDFVIMFIPGEHFLSAAAERAPDLIEGAFRNGVIIASTINMLALAKIMAGMWRQETLAAQAKEVAEVGKELYRRLSVMGAHVAKLGRNLNLATGAYNDFVGSLESQVLTQAKRFEALKIETGGKAIEPMPMVEAVPRVLTKLSGEETAEAAE
ncbi:MAG TPA: DNA recombination protein RmuC [Allosphingosinicella sp.]|nr:DNA recombination protein RmuC [Allosphingosinicella sp.]